LCELGALAFERGQGDEAESHYRQALDVRKQALGENHIEYVNNLRLLAVLYQSRGDYHRAQGRPEAAEPLYAAAEPLLKQHLEIVRRAVGEDDPFLIPSLQMLANLHRAQGQPAAAEPLYRQALAIVGRMSEPDERLRCGVRDDLAVLYLADGRYDAAEP